MQDANAQMVVDMEMDCARWFNKKLLPIWVLREAYHLALKDGGVSIVKMIEGKGLIVFLYERNLYMHSMNLLWRDIVRIF